MRPPCRTILISRAAAAVRSRSPGEVARSKNYKSLAIVVSAFNTLFHAAPENPETMLHRTSTSVWPLLFIYVPVYNITDVMYIVYIYEFDRPLNNISTYLTSYKHTTIRHPCRYLRDFPCCCCDDTSWPFNIILYTRY